MKYIGIIILCTAPLLFLSNCSSSDARPSAEFLYEPEIGNTRTSYHFDASASSDSEDSLGSLQFRWDWESDLIWDTDFSSVPYASHQFEEGGNKKVRLEIKDTNGNFDYMEEVIKVVQINSGNFTDLRDGREYEWITMGGQTWMAENLNWDAGEGSWYYWRIQYGRLYNWQTAMKACPSGWHLPSDGEWARLESRYAMNVWNRSKGFDESGEIGYKFKSRIGWSANCNGTNQYEFNVVPAGYRNFNGKYARERMMSYFWTATDSIETHAYNRGFHFASKGISRDMEDKRIGYSVRCVKDNVPDDVGAVTTLDLQIQSLLSK